MTQLPPGIIQQAAQLFKVLSEPNRLSILQLVAQEELNVTAISKSLGIEQSAVSHQLKILKDYHLVQSKRQGKSVIYFPDDTHVYGILDQVFEHSQEIIQKEED